MNRCPKCKRTSGNDWSQCGDSCPMPQSPHYKPRREPGPSKKTMSVANHKARHKLLHRMLDELVADFIDKTGRLPSSTSLMSFMEWSNEQTKNPTVKSQLSSAIAEHIEKNKVKGKA